MDNDQCSPTRPEAITLTPNEDTRDSAHVLCLTPGLGLPFQHFSTHLLAYIRKHGGGSCRCDGLHK